MRRECEAMVEDKGGAAELEGELGRPLPGAAGGPLGPRSIDFRADLPRHDTAKLYERLLRDGYAAQAAGSSRQAQGTS
jgi:long-chain acyl-CoA synthetase